MLRNIVLAVGMGMLAMPAWAGQVYKCKDTGATVYSDHPCGAAPDQQNLSIASSGRDGLRPGERELLREVEKREREAEEARARADEAFLKQEQLRRQAQHHEVAIGMDIDLVRTAWGAPDTVRRGLDKRGEWENWTYNLEAQGADGEGGKRKGKRKAHTKQVRFRNGIAERVTFGGG